MILNEKYIRDIDDEDDDSAKEESTAFNKYPINWKVVIHPDSYIDVGTLESDFEIDRYMRCLDDVLDNISFFEQYKMSVKIYPYSNPKNAIETALNGTNFKIVENDDLSDFSVEVNKIFDEAYANITSADVAFAFVVDINFILNQNCSYDNFAKSFGNFCTFFDDISKTLVGVLHEKIYVQLIQTDGNRKRPYFTYINNHLMTPTDIDNTFEILFDKDGRDFYKFHKSGDVSDVIVKQHRWYHKQRLLPPYVMMFIKECKNHKALPQYNLTFQGCCGDNHILLALDDKKLQQDDIPTVYADFKGWLENIPQTMYDCIVTSNGTNYNRNSWSERHVFYVYVLLNSDRINGGDCPQAYECQHIEQFKNLTHHGRCLDIKIYAIDKNFNAVGIYGCNVKDTIIKKCKDALYNLEYQGLI